MSFRKNKIKDPERGTQIIEPVYSRRVVQPMDTMAVMKEIEENRQQKIKETPRLEEFENIVKQYINDYITFQVSRHVASNMEWSPTIDSIYFCYSRIKGQINGVTFTGDKEFREWFNNESIEDIRNIIAQEITTFIHIRMSSKHLLRWH